MLYEATVQDMLATLPPCEAAELVGLIAGAAGHDTETGGTSS